MLFGWHIFVLEPCFINALKLDKYFGLGLSWTTWNWQNPSLVENYSCLSFKYFFYENTILTIKDFDPEACLQMVTIMSTY